MEERVIDFDKTVESVIQELRARTKYPGDISDLGNEIGFALGKSLENMKDIEIRDFIFGLRHGISLTNDTHG